MRTGAWWGQDGQEDLADALLHVRAAPHDPCRLMERGAAEVKSKVRGLYLDTTTTRVNL